MERIALLTLCAAVALAACGDPEPAGGALPPLSPITAPVTGSPNTKGAATTLAPEATPAVTAIAEPVLQAVGGPLYEPGAAVVAHLVGSQRDVFERAIAAGGLGPVRVAWEDGNYLDLNDDLNPGRVNIALMSEGEGSVVVDAFVETDPDTGSAAPEAVVIGVHEGVGFYPACGNEQLEHDGVVWYQVQPSEYPELYDRAVNGFREQAPESIDVRGFAPRVAEPGPGDDTGTLVIWSDGVAYFVSDSGDLYAWLVTDELEYGWVC